MNSSARQDRNIRVYILEPQGLLSKALCNTFAEDELATVVGTAGALDPHAFASARPDIVIYDADHDLSSIKAVVAECRASSKDVRVCILSSHLRTEVMLNAICSGADGYLIKDMSPADLLAAVHIVAHDGFYADPRLAGALLRRHAIRAGRENGQLSPRETDVARLVAEGLSNKEIGERLLLSDKTVKNHISSIFTKLNVTGRTHIVIHAMKTGLV